MTAMTHQTEITTDSKVPLIRITREFDAPPTKVTGKDVPMPYAANLEKLALPTVDDIVAAAKAVCYRD